MESREYKHNRYLEKLEKHKENSRLSAKYSSDRFDILIISLSTTSLVLSIGFIKDFIKGDSCINLTLIKLAWVFFAASIISNLVSQITGYFTSIYDIKIDTNLIREERGKSMKGNNESHVKVSNRLNMATLLLNGLSFLCLIFGIIFIIIFFNKNI
ncbi:hypothetical protein HER15_02830 [Tenacibaculum mesophilum]|uniref:Uncharacterized protein n=1 Tax=Tenacibaculum mesophilum TaxID=104268 RepID=A0AAE9MM06_9FLAO|nr:hypothetical protein [Tenacibaculum mesophilum]UTD14469.1 hypothetical protein HER15_02830 [Tenacibaculum mesophilum]